MGNTYNLCNGVQVCYNSIRKKNKEEEDKVATESSHSKHEGHGDFDLETQGALSGVDDTCDKNLQDV